MTENEKLQEAIDEYKENLRQEKLRLALSNYSEPLRKTIEENIRDIELEIKWLEEIQQYRAIGTVEECRVAVERMKPKKSVKDEYDRLTCPNCAWIVYQDEYGGRSLPCCENCGQTIDWS